MKLWRVLKERMMSYGDKIAFTDGKITYRNLINLVEDDQIGGGRLRIVEGRSKQGMALEILRCVANGFVAVPVDMQYGLKYVDYVQKTIIDDKEVYPDLAFIIFTSGTTGMPKGVMLSENAIIENIMAIEEYFSVHTGQKMTIIRPLVHISALTGELLFGLFRGLEISFFEGVFLPAKAGKFFMENKTEVIGCTPTVLYHLYQYIFDTCLTDIVISGERISAGLISITQALRDRINFYNVYGLTENGPRVAALCPQDFFRKIGSVGKPIRNTQVKIEDGELLVRSPSIMDGYYNRQDVTKKRVLNGWLHTGDYARIDEEDYLYILGRKDGMIIRCGVNVFPEEVESEANSIEGVQECIVYGVDDLRFGQIVCMDYVGIIDEVALRRILIKRLPNYMVPSRIYHVVRIEKTASGKIKRK